MSRHFDQQIIGSTNYRNKLKLHQRWKNQHPQQRMLQVGQFIL